MMKEAKNLRDEKYAEFNRTFRFDRRLFTVAVRVNLAYCDALFQAGVITRIESERIKNGLQTILKRADFYKDFFDQPSTSVHSFIETRLVQLIGDAGIKLNIGRSRYDQIVTAFRLWLREEIQEISKNTRELQAQLINAGERQKEAVLPAYANSQKAQPILWVHWCLAYFEMFSRDRERLDEVWRRVNVLPLGAADLAGTFIEIDREEIGRALGFEGVSANSLDTVSDTDFAVESLSACSLLMIHLSRLANELILYQSAEFGFVEFAGTISSDSNFLSRGNISEVLELVRAKAGKIFGHQFAVFTTMKSLPLGVHKDTQEIMEAVFDSVDTMKSCLQIVSTLLADLRVNESRTLDTVTKGYLNVAQLTDYLVQRDVPLKSAENSVREIVSYAVSQGKNLEDLSLEEFKKFSEHVSGDVFQSLSLEQTLASKNQIGGTSPERVFEALEAAKENLEREEANCGF